MTKILNNWKKLNIENLNSEIELIGFLQSQKKFKTRTFLLLRHESDVIECMVSSKISIPKESLVKVKGVISKKENNSLILENCTIEVIFRSDLSLPITVDKIDSLSPKIISKFRYLYLRNPRVHQRITLRAKLFKIIRHYLDELGFIEIDTPILSSVDSSGAEQFLTRDDMKNAFFALPQSPQIYKQLLISSGFFKYYQIAKSFRNEKSRSDRQKEFLQLDLELALTNEIEIYKIVMDLIELTFKQFGLKIENLLITKISYHQAMKDYGIDKPDLRIDNKIEYKKERGFKLKFEDINSLNYNDFIEKHLENIISEFKKFNSRLMFENSIINNKLVIELNTEYKFLETVGQLRNIFVNHICKYLEITKFSLVWINEFPLFKKNSKEELSFYHNPFSQPIDSEQISEKSLSKSYDLVINGIEILSGGIRNNSFELQKKIFKFLKIEINDTVANLMESFNYGSPYSGGFGLGIDRFLMILLQTDNINEVIPFPKTTHGKDHLTNSPVKLSKNT